MPGCGPTYTVKIFMDMGDKSVYKYMFHKYNVEWEKIKCYNSEL